MFSEPTNCAVAAGERTALVAIEHQGISVTYQLASNYHPSILNLERCAMCVARYK